METLAINDSLFRSAVEAIDTGDLPSLQQLLKQHPELTSRRLDTPEEGYFKHPYLLWFIANNPIRKDKMPENIIAITRLILEVARQNARDSYQQQIEYALGLAESGRILKECGVQLELIDLLIEYGATPGNGHGALTHGNLEAAQHIIEKSGIVTLTAAICLDRHDDTRALLKKTATDDKQIALMAAAFYGRHEAIRLLIESRVDVNGYIDHGFHTHASPLHQAVFSGSFETVKLLVEAGADLHATDKIYKGTPSGWAKHMLSGITDERTYAKYARIESYLKIKTHET